MKSNTTRHWQDLPNVEISRLLDLQGKRKYNINRVPVGMVAKGFGSIAEGRDFQNGFHGVLNSSYIDDTKVNDFLFNDVSNPKVLFLNTVKVQQLFCLPSYLNLIPTQYDYHTISNLLTSQNRMSSIYGAHIFANR
jgi:hypothetical protein